LQHTDYLQFSENIFYCEQCQVIVRLAFLPDCNCRMDSINEQHRRRRRKQQQYTLQLHRHQGETTTKCTLLEPAVSTWSCSSTLSCKASSSDDDDDDEKLCWWLRRCNVHLSLCTQRHEQFCQRCCCCCYRTRI